MILFWPITLVAGLIYADVWAKSTSNLTFTIVEGADWVASLLFLIQGYVVLTVTVVFVAAALSKHLRVNWSRAPQSDLVLFVFCWILAVAVLLNPNVIVGIRILLSEVPALFG